jgi:hypothetical protein
MAHLCLFEVLEEAQLLRHQHQERTTTTITTTSGTANLQEKKHSKTAT